MIPLIPRFLTDQLSHRDAAVRVRCRSGCARHRRQWWPTCCCSCAVARDGRGLQRSPHSRGRTDGCFHCDGDLLNLDNGYCSRGHCAGQRLSGGPSPFRLSNLVRRDHVLDITPPEVAHTIVGPGRCDRTSARMARNCSPVVTAGHLDCSRSRFTERSRGERRPALDSGVPDPHRLGTRSIV